MADRLSALLRHFPLRAQVQHAGPLVGGLHSAGRPGWSQLQLLRRGALRWRGVVGGGHDITQPTLLFQAQTQPHRLEPVAGAAGAPCVLVCAEVDFGAGSGNPLLQDLPAQLAWPLADLPALAPTLELLFAEAETGRCGQQAVLDRLCELLLIQFLRHLMQRQQLPHGVVAGLADPRLARALAAMHEAPQRGWTLALMAREAGMSRARFAARFAEVVRTPPGDYLARWRISLAQSLLRRGEPVKAVALEVGYGSAAALSRAFRQRVGMAPAHWAAQDADSALTAERATAAPQVAALEAGG